MGLVEMAVDQCASASVRTSVVAIVIGANEVVGTSTSQPNDHARGGFVQLTYFLPRWLRRT